MQGPNNGLYSNNQKNVAAPSGENEVYNLEEIEEGVPIDHYARNNNNGG